MERWEPVSAESRRSISVVFFKTSTNSEKSEVSATFSVCAPSYGAYRAEENIHKRRQNYYLGKTYEANRARKRGSVKFFRQRVSLVWTVHWISSSTVVDLTRTCRHSASDVKTIAYVRRKLFDSLAPVTLAPTKFKSPNLSSAICSCIWSSFFSNSDLGLLSQI